MISSLNGNIILKRDKFLIIEVGGVGYQVFLSRKTLSNLSENADAIKVFCYQNVKEDALDLYGFLTYQELEFFEILMDIRGVGPKAALEISSLGSLEKIKDKILAGDVKIFEGIPNIGAKKAMTIILELTGKIKMLSSTKAKGSADPAEDTLVQLGFARPQVKEVLAAIDVKIKDSEEKVKAALKILGNNKSS